MVYPGAALRRSRRINNRSFFPDDILFEILCRLPAKDVLRSRCVCREWRDLTSTLDFTDLYIRRYSIPMILKKDWGGLDLLDGCWEPARTLPDIHKLYNYRADNGFRVNDRGDTSRNGLIFTRGDVMSHNGLIVTYGYTRNDRDAFEHGVVIHNPIYRDVFHIIPPKKPDIRNFEVYGAFFHPIRKEYCTLWRTTLSLKPWKIQYKVVTLESNPKWRDIKNPCNQNARLLIGTVLIDKYLYWMVQPYQNYKIGDKSSFNSDILEYDIANEEFRMIPCPVTVNVVDYHYYNVSLIDSGGVLSLVKVTVSKEKVVKITIWTLKGDGEQLWTRSDYIISYDVHSRYGRPTAVAFRNEELVLQSDTRLYVCNLKLGTYRKLGQGYNQEVKFLSHVTSLVSLRNCKSKIHPETLRNHKSKICVVEEDGNNPKKQRFSRLRSRSWK